MSAHVEQVYMQCLRSPIDSRELGWDDLINSAFKLPETWGSEHVLPGVELLLRGLIRTRIVAHGRWWRLPELGEAYRKAWVMPIYEGDVLIELVAFSVTKPGTPAEGPWLLVDGVDALGLDGERQSNSDRGRVLTIFTQPYDWVMHWLKCCRANPTWLKAPETGPESCAALVLDRTRVNWRPYQIEPAGVTSGVEEVYCADDPALAEYIAKAVTIVPPKLPIVTRRRPTAKQEGVSP